MTKILIADDHAIFREGLRRIIEAEPDFDVVGEASTSREALSRARALEPDLIVLDLRMPGRGALETVKEIRSRGPLPRVLVLTAQPEDHYAVRVLRAGANGYLTKDAAPTDLIAALRQVASGGKYIGPRLAETIAWSVSPDGKREPHEGLSEREFEVMLKIAKGQSVNEIAQELALSPKTVSTYRTRVFDKMGFRSNAELIRYVLRTSLIE